MVVLIAILSFRIIRRICPCTSDWIDSQTTKAVLFKARNAGIHYIWRASL